MIPQQLELKKLPSELFHKNRNKKALVYHPNALTRSAVINALSTLGILTTSVSILSDKISEVKETLLKEKPEFIICSTEIDNHSFIEILNLHEEIFPSRLNCLFCVIGKDGSLSSGSILLEHFLDAYLASPLSPQTLNNTLVDQIILKENPSEQAKLFDSARKEFIKKNFNKAQEYFLRLTEYELTAPLAYNFLGQILEKTNNSAEAIFYYTKGVELKNPSYLCLKNCINLLIKGRHFSIAYNVGQYLLEKYPFNPNDIPALLQIFVANKKHSDIIKLMELVKNAESVDPKLKTFLSAGLVIGAKLLFEHHDPVNAMATLENACLLSSGNDRVLEQSCIILAEFHYKNEALKLLEKNSGPNMPKELFLKIQLEIFDKAQDYQSMMKLGQDLMRYESRNLRNFELFLNAAKVLKMSDRIIDNIAEDIKKKFPEKSQEFLQKYNL